MTWLFLLICIFGVQPNESSDGRHVTVRNDIPRKDVDGNILHVGDGDLRYFPHLKKFYLYGTKYQPCTEESYGNITGCYWFCGWRNMTYAVYSSEDLMTWKLESDDAVPQVHDHPVWNNSCMAFFEPSVIYNKKTKMYVMWFVMQNNLMPHKGVHGQGCAVSESPIGPFKFVEPIPSKVQPPSADLYLWVDPDTEKAYMKHNVNVKPRIPGNYVTLLSDDYTKMLATSPPVGASTYKEGGGIFKRNGKWFVTFGVGCCFCPYGGSSELYTTDDPLGNWTFVRQINPLVNATNGQCANTRARPQNNQCYAVPAQQFGFTNIPLADGTEQILYLGMRFGSAPDKVKSHDFQYWYPLEFDENGFAKPLTWVNSFSLTIPSVSQL